LPENRPIEDEAGRVAEPTQFLHERHATSSLVITML
jgi:hypothetical protein